MADDSCLDGFAMLPQEQEHLELNEPQPQKFDIYNLKLYINFIFIIDYQNCIV